MTVSARLRGTDRTLLAIVGVTAVALLARVVALGDRIAHWDEGRVGYEILRYWATGAWEYRPIVHGPFLPHVNRLVFELMGASDFTARLAVAVVGGLLPLAAWLYRDHLRNVEVVALSLFLAADPVLLYYSRFMRNDVLVAGFAFVALGCLLRLGATRRTRYVYAGTASLALAFTAKENALLYVVVFLGGGVLLLDHRLFLARDGDPNWIDVARRDLGRIAAGVWRWRLALVVALVEFLAIIVYFYAPRAGATGGIGLDAVGAAPGTLPAVVGAATVGAAENMVSSWITGSSTDHAYLPFLGHYLQVLASASGAMVLLAGIGFVADRYGGRRPRDVVSLGFYAGVVSVLGYPIVVDINSAWAVVHAIVPFTLPAAAGAATIYGWGRDALDADDRIGAGLAAMVLVLVAAGTLGTAVSSSYLSPQGEENVLVQYAQPAGEMRPTLRSVEAATADHDGLDVLYYGDFFLVENESGAYRLPIGDAEWYNRLPLPWYFERYGATVNSTADRETLDRWLADDPPPVIVVRENEVHEIEPRLSGYRSARHHLRQPVAGSEVEVVIFVADSTAA